MGSCEKGVTRSLLGSLGSPEHPFADDVALHLVRSAVDGRSLGEERHLGDAACEGVARGVLEGGLVVTVVGVERAGRSHDAQAEVAGQAHDLAHGELGHVGHAGDVAALLLDRLDPKAVEAAELAQRVEPGQVLADAGVVVDPAGLGHADEQAGAAAHGAERAARGLGLLLAARRPGTRCDQVAHPPGKHAHDGAGLGQAAPSGVPAAGAEAGPLVHERRVGGGPAVVQAADEGRVGHPGVGDEDLVEERVAGHLLERAHVDAVLEHVEGEVGDALVLGHVGVGPGQQHAEVGVLAARGPHLLPVDDPLVAVLDGPGLQAGEVRARLRLAEELAPGLLAGDDVPDVEVDLLLGPVGRDGRGGQEQPQPGGGAQGAEFGDLLLHQDDVGAGHGLAVGVLGQARGGPAGQAHAFPPLRPPSGRGPSCCPARTGARSAARRSAVVSVAVSVTSRSYRVRSGNGKLPRNMGSVPRMQDDRLNAAFDAWLQAQTAALDVVRQATGVPETDVDLAEGYRWVTRLSRLALDWIVEQSDPLHPQLFILQDEYKKLLVDNPDVHYIFCVLDDTRSYRLVGYRGECAYLGMTFGTPFGQGQVGGRTGTQTQTHIDEFELGPNGEVDILIAPASAMPDPRPRNAVVLEPGTAQLAIRETHFEKRPGAPVRPAHGVGARAGRGRAAADPLRRRAGAQARVRRHVPHLRGRDRAADVARRGQQHEHLRGPGRLGPRRGAGGRGAHALQRGDDVPRRALPAGARARRWWSPCTSPTSRSSTGG